MVSVAIITLAALPHQLPLPMTWGLRTNIGRILGLSVVVAAGYYRPILGMAIAILLISTNLSDYVEGYSNQTISKDKVEKKQRWTSEEIMSEEPEAIQERSETVLLKDTVTSQDAKPWLDERTLNIHPKGVQERTSPDLPFQETDESEQTKNSK